MGTRDVRILAVLPPFRLSPMPSIVLARLFVLLTPLAGCSATRVVPEAPVRPSASTTPRRTRCASPARRTCATCASSRSAATTPRRTGAATSRQLIFQSDWAASTAQGCDQQFVMNADGSPLGGRRAAVARTGPRGPRRALPPRLDRTGPDHLRLLPADGPSRSRPLRLDARRGPACPPSGGRAGPLRVGDLRHVRHLHRRRPTAPTPPARAGPGYDAEATVSPDGRFVIFTSTRSGDLELWRLELATGALSSSPTRRATTAARSSRATAAASSGAPRARPATNSTTYRTLLARRTHRARRARPVRRQRRRLERAPGDATCPAPTGRRSSTPTAADHLRVQPRARSQDGTGGRTFALYRIGMDGSGPAADHVLGHLRRLPACSRPTARSSSSPATAAPTAQPLPRHQHLRRRLGRVRGARCRVGGPERPVPRPLPPRPAISSACTPRRGGARAAVGEARTTPASGSTMRPTTATVPSGQPGEVGLGERQEQLVVLAAVERVGVGARLEALGRVERLHVDRQQARLDHGADRRGLADVVDLARQPVRDVDEGVGRTPPARHARTRSSRACGMSCRSTA